MCRKLSDTFSDPYRTMIQSLSIPSAVFTKDEAADRQHQENPIFSALKQYFPTFYSTPTSSVLFELQSGLFWEPEHICSSQPWGQQGCNVAGSGPQPTQAIRTQGQLLGGKAIPASVTTWEAKRRGLWDDTALNCKCQISIFTSGPATIR